LDEPENRKSRRSGRRRPSATKADRSPWLDIPLADYEGHMSLPEVGQARLLSDVFASVLDRHAPRSVAVLGCAGGNGFERISPESTDRVVGVDINGDYVREARARFGRRLHGLELIVGDLERDAVAFAPVDLVFAGLIFEYVDVEGLLPKTRAMLRPGGTLVALIQLPSEAVPEVTPSPFTSLGVLSSRMRLVSPERLERSAGAHGFRETDREIVEVPGGKRFQLQTFRFTARP
jgi:hypothetical protein